MIKTWHRLQELNEKFSQLSVDKAQVLYEEEVCITAARPEWAGLERTSGWVSNLHIDNSRPMYV